MQLPGSNYPDPRLRIAALDIWGQQYRTPVDSTRHLWPVPGGSRRMATAAQGPVEGGDVPDNDDAGKR